MHVYVSKQPGHPEDGLAVQTCKNIGTIAQKKRNSWTINSGLIIDIQEGCFFSKGLI